ncbi:MAG: S41 family peptidase [Bacteroidales bacterium]|nr:S41 family peptidase [Bacteroidales bacterium]
MKKNLIQLITLFVLLAFNFSLAKAQNGDEFEISKNLDIYSTLYKELNSNYVDDLNHGDLMQTGIKAMLDELDPYTTYIPESRIEDYKMMTTGEYGGMGALIHKQGKYVVVSEPYQGFPADKAGLIAGDKILEINGTSMKGKSTDEVSELLKGQPGTKVTLKVERPGKDEPVTTEIVREEVKIDHVPFYGMVNDTLGYIKLTGFTRNIWRDVKEALVDLKDNHNLKGLVFDVRGNGGGLLQESVNIVNLFIDKGETVVKTKGKLESKNQSHKTSMQPIDTELPLVVLVNESSASASEILAGAIQDFDRGVIVGQRTFGKGLVQNVVPLSYNTRLKVTVAKYYIPSGRCIQAIDYSHKDEDGYFTKIPDSLTTAFKTRNDRTVYDGGGIEPDIELEPRRMSKLTGKLYTDFLIFDYATKFYLNHKTVPKATEFEVNDTLFSDFTDYVVNRDFTYTTETEKKLEELEEKAKKEKYFEHIEEVYKELKAKLADNKRDDLVKIRDEIEPLLEGELVTRYYYREGRIKATLSDDQEIQKAIDILKDGQRYNEILDGGYVSKDEM